jgi:CRISPR-associated protein Csx16
LAADLSGKPTAGRTRLVSFLGTGPYQETCHRLVDGRQGPPTKYACRALAGLLSADEVDVLATAEAEAAHGAQLAEALKSANLPAPTFHRVPKGEHDAELWQQFGMVKDRLRPPAGTAVALDVTHAFRSQPFFAAAVSAFVRAIDPKPAPVSVFYAAFEARHGGVTPVWELTPFIDLLDWAHSIMLFLRTGRSDDVAGQTDRLGRDIKRRWAKKREGPPPALDALGRELQRFGRNLETIRTGALLAEGEGSAARVAERLGAARASADALPPLADVLDRLEREMLAPLIGAGADLTSAEGHRALAALARLYLRMGRWAEAAAIVREGWVTLHSDPSGVFDTEARRLAEARWNRVHRDVVRQVAQARNDIEHAGFRARPLPADAVREQIGRLVEGFDTATATVADAWPVFLNISNHPSAAWGETQRQAALALAPEIRDLLFPPVPPEADAEWVAEQAEEILQRALEVAPGATHAMVQGEFTLAHALVGRLRAQGIVTLAATTSRDVDDNPDGSRTSRFTFVRFREYA